MNDRIPDTEIAVKIARSTDPNTHEWIAKSKTKPKLLGAGDTPEDALDRFVDDLQQEVKHPETISHEITGMTATVRIYVPENHPLSDFGVGVHDATDTPAPEGAEILAPPEPEHNPITDYSNCIPEAFALMAMLEIEKGFPIVVEEAEGQCARYQTTLEKVEARYPQIISRFEETRIDPDGSEEEFDMIEFWWGGDWAEELPKQMKKASDQPMEEEEETPSSDELSEEGTCCRNDDPFELAYGISLDRYAIGRISDERQRYIVLPSTPNITPGVRILVYEKGEMKGRRAYVGEFVAGEKFRIERGDSEATRWMNMLCMDFKQFEALFGTQISRFVLEIVDYKDYTDPIAIPDGMKAPRGVNWIPPMYLGKLFPEDKE